LGFPPGHHEPASNVVHRRDQALLRADTPFPVDYDHLFLHIEDDKHRGRATDERETVISLI
jgi:hypothetical protein